MFEKNHNTFKITDKLGQNTYTVKRCDVPEFNGAIKTTRSKNVSI